MYFCEPYGKNMEFHNNCFLIICGSLRRFRDLYSIYQLGCSANNFSTLWWILFVEIRVFSTKKCAYFYYNHSSNWTLWSNIRNTPLLLSSNIPHIWHHHVLEDIHMLSLGSSVFEFTFRDTYMSNAQWLLILNSCCYYTGSSMHKSFLYIFYNKKTLKQKSNWMEPEVDLFVIL